jgi:FKBP-type peptidyl-prolyl cis-trans isomerase
MATSKKGRAFAGFFAGLFLLTSSALTIGVIWQMVQDHKSKANTTNTSQLNDAEKKALAEAQAQQKASNKVTLQGTKLANFTPVSKIDKLEVNDTTPGTGDTVKPGDTVTVDYTGAIATTGTIFQSSLDTGQPVPLVLKSGPGGVIDGWVQGIPGMKVGGTRRLLIPYSLAYAGNPPSGIPVNADLVFDVTVHKIGK